MYRIVISAMDNHGLHDVFTSITGVVLLYTWIKNNLDIAINIKNRTVTAVMLRKEELPWINSFYIKWSQFNFKVNFNGTSAT